MSGLDDLSFCFREQLIQLFVRVFEGLNEVVQDAIEFRLIESLSVPFGNPDQVLNTFLVFSYAFHKLPISGYASPARTDSRPF